MAGVAFRVDASSRIGTGHLVRCLTLARELRERGHRPVFATRTREPALHDRIIAAGVELLRMAPAAAAGPGSENGHDDWLGRSWPEDAAETCGLLRSAGDIAAIVVDHYGVDARWEREVGSALAAPCMVIDDLADRPHACALLLDQNYYAGFERRYDGLVEAGTPLLLGPGYALLRPEFAALRRSAARDARPAVQRMLLFMGGADLDNVTARVLAAIVPVLPPAVRVEVVATAANPWRDALRALCAGDDRLHFHLGADMARLMAGCDLAIGAGGTTVWERCCLGLPSIVIPVAANQEQAARDLAAHGAIRLVEPGRLEAELPRALGSLLDEAGEREALSHVSAALVDGLGATRVGERLSQILSGEASR